MSYGISVTVGDKLIGVGQPPFIIAEIGVNFDGKLEVAKRLVDAAAWSGADAVKFQTFRASEIVGNKDLLTTYSVADGTEITESQYEMFKRLELPDDWHEILKLHAEKLGMIFFSSVIDKHSVDLLDSLDVLMFKVASVDLPNTELLEYVAQKRKPIILSTGMATEMEIDQAVKIISKFSACDLVLLHCVSVYPTPLEGAHLKKIQSLQERFALPVGFSDHTESSVAAILAIGLGCCVFEKHFTLDRTTRGPDHKMSMEPKQFKKYGDLIRSGYTALGSGRLTFTDLEAEVRDNYRCSIVARYQISKGEVITEEMIAYRRPSGGLEPYERNQIIGKKARNKIVENQYILLKDVD